MATPAAQNPSLHTTPLGLETLQLLPCGCVTAVRRAFQWGLVVISIEAKGPHCNLAVHTLGRVVVGEGIQAGDEEDEEATGAD